MKRFFVYLMASKQDGVLYLGVTANLKQRAHQHRNGLIEGFTKKYQVKRLVWFEEHSSADSAITREIRIKKWRRAWKVELIEEMNPNWATCSIYFLRKAACNQTAKRNVLQKYWNAVGELQVPGPKPYFRHSGRAHCARPGTCSSITSRFGRS